MVRVDDTVKLQLTIVEVSGFQPQYSILHPINFSISFFKRQVNVSCLDAYHAANCRGCSLCWLGRHTWGPYIWPMALSASFSLPGAFNISIAFSRQKRALAGRFSERNSARASSVMSGLAFSASMVICNLS